MNLLLLLLSMNACAARSNTASRTSKSGRSSELEAANAAEVSEAIVVAVAGIVGSTPSLAFKGTQRATEFAAGADAGCGVDMKSMARKASLVTAVGRQGL